MTLYEKIKTIYPEIEMSSFERDIVLENDGFSEKIVKWNHPTLKQPTQAQLDKVK